MVVVVMVFLLLLPVLLVPLGLLLLVCLSLSRTLEIGEKKTSSLP